MGEMGEMARPSIPTIGWPRPPLSISYVQPKNRNFRYQPVVTLKLLITKGERTIRVPGNEKDEKSRKTITFDNFPNRGHEKGNGEEI
jgi:hypothetical protein